MPADHVSFLWRHPDRLKRFRTAVSLHSHTMHSREHLGFIPKILRSVPIALAILRKLEERYEKKVGRPLEYERGYWTPPLSAHDVLALEKRQIEEQTGLRACVSITDHDDLEACNLLRLLDEGRDLPLSLEWTVPFEQAAFHIGVHNLPPSDSAGWLRDLQGYTRAPEQGRLMEMLRALAELPGVLVVLNHPFSDEGRVGHAIHRGSLEEFLRRHKPFLHALELNGMHRWKDNLATIRLARHIGLPFISGGDRHGCEANANLNLTAAQTIEEFIQEVRDGHSHVLFMPHYRESLTVRYIENIWQIVRDYPDSAGRQHWADRVFFDHPLLGFGALSTHLARIPGPVTAFMGVIGWLMSPRVRSTLVALAPRQEIVL